MATISKNFLEVDDAYPYERKPRSHSSGHVDRIEEQERHERRDRDRRMKEYHDSTRKTPTIHHRRTDHLEIPIYETNQRLRSGGVSDQQLKEPPQSPQSPQSPRNYRVEEFKPSPQLYDYDLDPETPQSSQLQRPLRGRTSRSDKSKAKVPPIIVQRTSTLPTDATSPSLKKSPSASPHSPTAQPVLKVQYAKLQHIFTQTSDSCEKYLEVEPASPQDLTFTKIRETVEGFAEDLHIWSHVADLDGLARIDRRLRHLVDAASDVLDRLLGRATELRETCANAKPKDLKMPILNDEEENEEIELPDDDDDSADQDPTETPGFVIQSLLSSIGMQIRHLKLLSTSLQEATPDVGDEMVNVARLVKEAGKYFGSEAALKRYSIDPKFAGKKALSEASFTADAL